MRGPRFSDFLCLVGVLCAGGVQVEWVEDAELSVDLGEHLNEEEEGAEGSSASPSPSVGDFGCKRVDEECIFLGEEKDVLRR